MPQRLQIDIGCDYGASTIIMAKAYSNSTFYGFDYHTQSIVSARKQAEREGLTKDRIKFEVASSINFPFPYTEASSDGSSNNNRQQEVEGYDLITFFDNFHDMSDLIQ